MEKLVHIVWLIGAILVTGLLMAVTGKTLQVPLAIVHKLLALVCLLLLIRAAGLLFGLHAPPPLPALLVVCAVAFLAAFVTGIVQSIPACASSLWLNLHRLAAAAVTVGCAAAARLIVIGGRT